MNGVEAKPELAVSFGLPSVADSIAQMSVYKDTQGVRPRHTRSALGVLPQWLIAVRPASHAGECILRRQRHISHKRVIRFVAAQLVHSADRKAIRSAN